MPTELRGAIALRKALRKFEPDLAKETTAQIGNFLKPVVKQARGFVPADDSIPSGWLKGNQKGKWENRAYNAVEVKRGITYKTTPSKTNRRGFRSLASIFNKSAAGAIYETAGRKSGVVGRFSPRLKGELVGHGQKMTGRAIFRAYDEDQGKAKAAVFKAIEKAAMKFEARGKNV